MKKQILFVIPFFVLVVSCNGGGGSSKAPEAPLAGIERYTIAYIEEDKAHENDRSFDLKAAYNRMKEGFEQHLTAAIGKTVKTNIIGECAVLDTMFTITRASGNVGRSTAVPYVILEAKVQTDKARLGYIARDKDGLPVFAGKAKVIDGKVKMEIDFSHSGGDSRWMVCSDRTLSSMVSIDLMDDPTFENHVLYCRGASYNKKGFGPVELFRSIDNIPDVLPGIYDKKELTSRVEEGPEEDFEYTQVVLGKGDETVAVVSYSSDDGKIYMIEVMTPEIIILPELHTYDGNMVLNCRSEALLLLYSGSGKGRFEYNEEYQEIPVIKLGWTVFSGMEIKEQKASGNSEFYASDLVDGTRANKIRLVAR